jgi:hypothetical protein
MGEVVSGQSAPFYMTKAAGREDKGRRQDVYFQNKTENPLIAAPIIKRSR